VTVPQDQLPQPPSSSFGPEQVLALPELFELSPPLSLLLGPVVPCDPLPPEPELPLEPPEPPPDDPPPPDEPEPLAEAALRVVKAGIV
jgi:hypothetical protein